MDPVLAHAFDALSGAAMELAERPGQDFGQQLGPADPADQQHFEQLMNPQPGGVANEAFSAAWPANHAVSSRTGSDSIGSAILDQLEDLKTNSDATLNEIQQTLGKDNISTTDMLHVQFQLMALNLEIQTTSNMAHHGVEDIKTIMRGQ